MGQYWEFFNLTLKESGRRVGGAKWMEFFFARQDWLVRSLTIPFQSDKIDKWLEGFSGTTPFHDESILRFPNEVLLMIVHDIDDILWKVCFALTCKRLLSLSRDHIEELKKKRAAPWAGCRIACLGDYAHFEDLPKTLLTAKEASKVGKRKDSYRYGGLSFMLDRETPLFIGKAELKKDFVNRLSTHDRDGLLELYGLHYPASSEWVLCNLTTGQYVLARAVAACGRFPKDRAPFLPRSTLNLAHVVLHRICWSSDPSGTCGGSLARGKWTGHRFMITTLDRMPDVPRKKGGWSDISERVCRDLKDIWAAGS